VNDTPGPLPSNAPEYRAAAAKLSTEQLANVRSVAEKWTGTVATLLGIFSSVAVVTGASTLDKLPSEQARQIIVCLIVAAGIAAGVSIGMGAYVAQGTPRERSYFSGEQLRAIINDEMPKAVRLLQGSRVAGTLAAALVFIAGVIGLQAAVKEGPKSSSSVVVIDNAGVMRCGPLSAGPNQVATVGGREIPGASQVLPVGSC
jgi:hypothetical protein